jgi:prepilin-type N-terminal cleavage/methylation domain-containing protein
MAINYTKFEQMYIRNQNSKLKTLVSGYSQQDSGFSVIELIVVVLIIAVLASIAAPGWLGFVNRQRLNKANDAILAALQEAQREAKRTKNNYTVGFKVENKIPKIAVYPSASTTPDWQNLGGDLEIKPGQLALLTNLTGNNKTDDAGALNLNYNFLDTPKTITFDYLGTISDASFGKETSGETPGLKIAVAIPNTGNAALANDMKRCIILKTILGTTISEKDTKCN